MIRELAGIEKMLLRLQGAWKDKKRLSGYSAKFYDRMLETCQDIFDRAQELAKYINKLDSDELPFNIFKGDLDLARHGVPNREIQNATGVIDNVKRIYLGEKGERVEMPDVDWQDYQDSLESLEYALNCFRIFRLIASGNCRPETFRIREVVDRVLRYRRDGIHNRKVVFNEHVEDLLITFNRDALYWIIMRMLSNAEHATYKVENAWIRMQTFRQKDGTAYLIVRNNGMSMEERAKTAISRGGGKSRPNIDKLCRDLGSEFRLKGFPDHTRACLRLPLAK